MEELKINLSKLNDDIVSYENKINELNNELEKSKIEKQKIQTNFNVLFSNINKDLNSISLWIDNNFSNLFQNKFENIKNQISLLSNYDECNLNLLLKSISNSFNLTKENYKQIQYENNIIFTQKEDNENLKKNFEKENSILKNENNSLNKKINIFVSEIQSHKNVINNQEKIINNLKEEISCLNNNKINFFEEIKKINVNNNINYNDNEMNYNIIIKTIKDLKTEKKKLIEDNITLINKIKLL